MLYTQAVTKSQRSCRANAVAGYPRTSVGEHHPDSKPSFEGPGISPGAWSAPFLGERGIFESNGHVWAAAIFPDQPKKTLCHTRPVGGTYDENQRARRAETLSSV